jgi:hypothetical protein
MKLIKKADGLCARFICSASTQGENTMINKDEMDSKVVLSTLRRFAVLALTYGNVLSRRTQ